MLTRKQARDKVTVTREECVVAKRPAANSPAMQPMKKRSALGDITNDLRNVQIDSSKKSNIPVPIKAEKTKSTGETEAKNVSTGSASLNDVSMLSVVEESPHASSSDEVMHCTPPVLPKEEPVAVALPVGSGIRTPFDKEMELDPYHIPHYAQDIFDYYRAREAHFAVGDYIDMQQAGGGITRQMRAILIDWMVEVQENFELNHETLYQAVKMTDLYLSKVIVEKEMLQLIGATCLFISSKFDERQPPLVDDFLYICDDAYSRDQILRTEQIVLKGLKFDIGFPLSYRYLRRYSKTTKADMVTLTLGRFILEMSLMHYEFVQVSESLIAAAAFKLALRMKGNVEWADIHVQYTGYSAGELDPLMWKLNHIIQGTPLTKALSNIRAKYSHDIFFGVAKLTPLKEPGTVTSE